MGNACFQATSMIKLSCPIRNGMKILKITAKRV